ncbi:hypothetical protein ANPL_03420 [Anaplasma platys]|uniref:Uncharacterized protein n=1 Tax=Anaplasma platys TaxID=949 RepID=A0A858PYU9_9RICK|nr:hypothetical protein ANPL_03420 [Anaplasma platys]
MQNVAHAAESVVTVSLLTLTTLRQVTHLRKAKLPRDQRGPHTSATQITATIQVMWQQFIITNKHLTQKFSHRRGKVSLLRNRLQVLNPVILTLNPWDKKPLLVVNNKPTR